MRALRVVAAGALTTVQDRGRPGLAHLGVPRAGWLDEPAATLANRLVGNPEGAAVLECLLGGLEVELATALTLAVTGAACPVRLGGRRAAHGAALSGRAGEVLGVGPATTGARCYVAVAGGIAVPPVLGSRATDTLSWTGPPPVRAGAVLPVGRRRGEPAAGEAVAAPAAGAAVELAVHPGPRADWFPPAALELLAASAYTVLPDSDRVGLRLDGPVLARSRHDELPSEGVVLGAVQVPAEGRPLVFLNDHPTTGGYPVLAVVDPASLPRCAQLLPGDPVRFRLSRPRATGAGGGAPG